MRIISRVLRLFKADMHAILDSLETPEAIVKQAVRDMRDEIEKSELQLLAVNKQQARLQQSEQKIADQMQSLQQQIGFCFEQRNEQLARSIIRKNLETECIAEQIAQQLLAVTDEKIALQQQLEERQQKLQTISEKLVLFSECSDDIDWQQQPAVNTVTPDDVELAFLYAKRQYGGQGAASSGEIR